MNCEECGVECEGEICDFCCELILESQKEDHRLDDPRHGQAKEINKERT